MTFPVVKAGRHVERAVIECCLRWGETWIAAIERQEGLRPRSLPVPAAGQFTTTSEDFVNWPEDQLPVVLVISPGLAGTVRTEADRSLTAPVGIALGILTSTSFGDAQTREVAHWYAMAYSEVLLRHELEIEVDEIRYIDERYGDIVREDQRALGAARVIFSIEVRNWRSSEGGPLYFERPPADPYAPPGELPRVERFNATVNEQRSIP